MSDRPPEIDFVDDVALPGICPECRQGALIATVDTVSDARIRHSRTLRMCKSPGSNGPKYFIHIHPMDENGERKEMHE